MLSQFRQIRYNDQIEQIIFIEIDETIRKYENQKTRRNNNNNNRYFDRIFQFLKIRFFRRFRIRKNTTIF